MCSACCTMSSSQSSPVDLSTVSKLTRLGACLILFTCSSRLRSARGRPEDGPATACIAAEVSCVERLIRSYDGGESLKLVARTVEYESLFHLNCMRVAHTRRRWEPLVTRFLMMSEHLLEHDFSALNSRQRTRSNDERRCERVLNALSVAVNRRSSAAKPPVRPAPIASPRACQSRDLLPHT